MRPAIGGHWQGRAPLENREEVPETLRNTAERINLLIYDNGTYDLVWMGLPIAGDVRWDGAQIVLEPKRVMEQPIDRLGPGMQNLGRPLRLEFEDGALIGLDFGPERTVLKRIGDVRPPSPRSR